MYRKHFGFTHFPFDLELQPDALFASNTIAEAQARLKHLLELRAIGLIGCQQAASNKVLAVRRR